MANKAIKGAASKLEHDEMAASPSHTMRKRAEGGVASAVQVRARAGSAGGRAACTGGLGRGRERLMWVLATVEAQVKVCGLLHTAAD